MAGIREIGAVNVSQSRSAFGLRSWDVFAYDPLSNQRRPFGACFLDGSAAVNVNQSRSAFGLRSWDVFAAAGHIETHRFDGASL